MKLLPNHVCSIPKGLWGLCNYYKYKLSFTFKWLIP